MMSFVLEPTVNPAIEQGTANSFYVEQINLMWELDLSQTYHRNRLNWRKKNCNKWAEQTVEWIRHYQYRRVESIGGKLPVDEKVFLIVGAMFVYETHIDPMRVGKIGEVGIGQCHGTCLNGHKKKAVKKNPELGIKLAVRWLSHCVHMTFGGDVDRPLTWREWSLVLSTYMTGKKRLSPIGPANKRVDLAKEFYQMYSTYGHETKEI